MRESYFILALMSDPPAINVIFLTRIRLHGSGLDGRVAVANDELTEVVKAMVDVRVIELLAVGVIEPQAVERYPEHILHLY